MAPNMTGIAEVDQPARCIWSSSRGFRRAGPAAGRDLLVKVFQGREFQPLVASLRAGFETSEAAQAESVQRSQPRGVRSGTGYRLV